MCLLVRIEEFVVLFLWLLCLVAIISLVLFLLKMLIPARLLELCARFRTIVITCLHRFWLTDLGWLLLLMMFWSLWYLLLNLLCLHFIFCDWHILSSFEFGFFDLFFMLSLIYFLFYFSEELLNFIECLLEKWVFFDNCHQTYIAIRLFNFIYCRVNITTKLFLEKLLLFLQVKVALIAKHINGYFAYWRRICSLQKCQLLL
jgi:hypothetical protein